MFSLAKDKHRKKQQLSLIGLSIHIDIFLHFYRKGKDKLVGIRKS